MPIKTGLYICYSGTAQGYCRCYIETDAESKPEYLFDEPTEAVIVLRLLKQAIFTGSDVHPSFFVNEMNFPRFKTLYGKIK
jgi:hypothetical protein